MIADAFDSIANTAVGVVIGVVFVVIIASVFSDLVFGMLGDIRRNWKRHMRS